MKNEVVVSLLLRVGVAFSFLYAAVQSFRDPTSWIGFFPIVAQELAEQTIGLENMLAVFSLVEIIVAIWLLSGWRGVWSGLVASAMLAGIVVTNLGAFDLVFRDVSILFGALAYAVLSHRRN